ncbi:MAG: class I SAM-dependent methyltransferase, partial [Gemmatimonadota bacterium]
MDPREAVSLLRPAIPAAAGTWADLGCGEGTFTRALAELLGPGSRVYAVDRSRRRLLLLDRWTRSVDARVIPLVADFTLPLDLPGLDPPGLDGLLLANALHFAVDAEAVLSRLAARVRPGGRVVLVEYDGRRANPWVPYPIPSERMPH